MRQDNLRATPPETEIKFLGRLMTTSSLRVQHKRPFLSIYDWQGAPPIASSLLSVLYFWWPDPNNGMWVVSPDYPCHAPRVSVTHIDTVFPIVDFFPAFDETALTPMLNKGKKC